MLVNPEIRYDAVIGTDVPGVRNLSRPPDQPWLPEPVRPLRACTKKAVYSEWPSSSSPSSPSSETDEEPQSPNPPSTLPPPAKPKKSTPAQKYWGLTVPLDGGRDQLLKAQREDPSLEICLRKARSTNPEYYYNDGLLKRLWTPPHQMEEDSQLVLPGRCRERVLRLAHSAPMAAHHGKHKTAARLLRCFFWPGIRQDVTDMCRRCPTC